MSRALLLRPQYGYSRFHLVVPGSAVRRVAAWLRHLSDGYVRFDDDLQAKLPGPIVVRDLGPADDSIPELSVLNPAPSVSEDGISLPQVSFKPYFIGLGARGAADLAGNPLPSFEWAGAGDDEPVRRTPLYDWHMQNGAKLAPFAGWQMPLWYTSIGDEHRAVRGAAGLFDVSHMGIFDVSGSHAAYFLNLVATNDVDALRPGESQYSYLLAPDGHVIDDIMVYRLTPSRFLVVVNAANTEKDWAWLSAVNEGRVRVDDGRPWARGSFGAELRDLHGQRESYAWQSDLALQGPRSLDILAALLDAAPQSSATAEIRARLMNLGRSGVLEAHIPNSRAPGGVFDLFIARTGYTGERLGFELFVHPDVLGTLWDTLLEVGAPSGLSPVGLGARDSLRIEAGLPLYGHELAGPLDLGPGDAGYSGFVKLHKSFFVGRQAYIEKAQKRRMAVARFQISEKGVRVPKQRDVVTDGRGRVIGEVTSCALDTEGYLIGLAHLDKRHASEGTEVFIFPHPTRESWEKPYEELEIGDRLVVHSEAVVVRRFRKR